MAQLKEYLEKAVSGRASDLFIVAGGLLSAKQENRLVSLSPDRLSPQETEELIRFIRIFSELTGKLKFSTQKRVLLEVTFIKLCRPQMEAGRNDALLARIRALETAVEKGMDAVSSGQISYAAAPEPADSKGDPVPGG